MYTYYNDPDNQNQKGIKDLAFTNECSEKPKPNSNKATDKNGKAFIPKGSEKGVR